MFFVLSKLLWIVAAPANAMVLVVLSGLALGAARREGVARAGRRLAALGLLLVLACALGPLGTFALRTLEDRFPKLPADQPPPVGIVVLGGSVDQTIGAARGRVTISDAADRITEAVILSRRYPAARLVFSGGTNALFGEVATEAADTRRLWIELGAAPERITIEDRSRNTDENARFTKALVTPRPGETWILVTSAYHMPRAVGLFRANDFPVVPDPVDYRTTGTAADYWPGTDVAGGLERLDMVAREWIGLVAYRLTGRTAVLFPGP